MPNISYKDREYLDDVVYHPKVKTKLQLSYVLMRELVKFLGASPLYDEVAGVLGVLENVKQDIYKRYMNPITDYASQKHGDVVNQILDKQNGR